MAICPHDNPIHCPLYIMAHVPDATASCDDGRLDEGGCAVTRNLNYAGAVALLSPRFVQSLRFAEEIKVINAQLARNRRLNGVH